MKKNSSEDSELKCRNFFTQKFRVVFNYIKVSSAVHFVVSIFLVGGVGAWMRKKGIWTRKG